LHSQPRARRRRIMVSVVALVAASLIASPQAAQAATKSPATTANKARSKSKSPHREQKQSRPPRSLVEEIKIFNTQPKDGGDFYEQIGRVFNAHPALQDLPPGPSGRDDDLDKDQLREALPAGGVGSTATFGALVETTHNGQRWRLPQAFDVQVNNGETTVTARHEEGSPIPAGPVSDQNWQKIFPEIRARIHLARIEHLTLSHLYPDARPLVVQPPISTEVSALAGDRLMRGHDEAALDAYALDAPGGPGLDQEGLERAFPGRHFTSTNLNPDSKDNLSRRLRSTHGPQGILVADGPLPGDSHEGPRFYWVVTHHGQMLLYDADVSFQSLDAPIDASRLTGTRMRFLSTEGHAAITPRTRRHLTDLPEGDDHRMAVNSQEIAGEIADIRPGEEVMLVGAALRASSSVQNFPPAGEGSYPRGARLSWVIKRQEDGSFATRMMWGFGTAPDGWYQEERTLPRDQVRSAIRAHALRNVFVWYTEKSRRR
jgi:hypothetical protein